MIALFLSYCILIFQLIKLNKIVDLLLKLLLLENRLLGHFVGMWDGKGEGLKLFGVLK